MQHERRCSRARRADVSFRDVKIETPGRNMTGGCEWRHDRKRGLRFENCQLVEIETWARPDDFVRYGDRTLVELVEFLLGKKKVDFRVLVVARRICALRVPRVSWVENWRCKSSQQRTIVYLSPYVEKSLNSKVIKSFVPEQRSRKCFLCFGIPMLSICALWTLWTFCVPVWICLFHIFMYGYVIRIEKWFFW